MNFSDQPNNGPPGSNNPRDNTPPGQYTYQGTTIKKVLDKNEACIPCRRRKTKCDGLRPACGTCSRLDRECIYVDKEPKEGSSRRSAKGSASHSTSSAITGSVSRLFHSRRERGSAVGAVNTPHSSSASLEMHDSPMIAENSHSPLSAHPGSSGVPPGELGMHSRGLSPQTQFSSSHPGTAQSLPNMIKLKTDNVNQTFLGPSAPGYGIYEMQFPEYTNYDSGLSPGHAFSVGGETLSGSNVGNSGLSTPSMAEQVLPSQQVVEEIVIIFFKVIHPLMPCLHQRRFLSELRSPGGLSVSSALLFAVLAITAPMHPDPTVQSKGYEWYLLCRQQIDMAAYAGRLSVRNVQAAVWWTFKSFLMGEMPSCWLMIGTAYRLAIPLGLHRVDAPHYQSFLPPPHSESHREERRRVMWAIYRMDRYSFCLGWPMAIDDKDLCVNYPVEEHIFQNSDTMEDIDPSSSEPFSPEINDLITPPTKPRGGLHYIHKLSVLIGKINNLNMKPYRPVDPAVRDKEFRALETSLTCFRAALPPELRSIIESTDPTAVAQLQTLLQCSVILLYHGAMVDPSTSNPGVQQNYPYGPSAESFSQGWGQQMPSYSTPHWSLNTGIQKESENFSLCLLAVQGVISTIKETIDLAETGIYNPWIAPVFFICARILCIRWLETQDPQVKADIDLILLMIDRISDLWGGVAGKYKELIHLDLQRDPATVSSLKYLVGGAYIGPECAPAYVGIIPDSAC